ncbi:dihydroorotase [Candidatus Falkowbacteria bacterium]|nr:dihydroorotase [Candidatus Falkowbacteria bacterium]
MHIHFRTGPMLINVLPFTSIAFQGAVPFGNTFVTEADDVVRYRREILVHAHKGFNPIMSIMLVNKTTPEIVEESFLAGARVLKWIPGGTSTNSKDGVSLLDMKKYYPVFAKAESLGMIVSVHWEAILNFASGKEIPMLYREEAAIQFFVQLATDFPGLKIVAEHITTKEMVKTVEILYGMGCNVAATITSHHPVLTYSDVCDADGNVINPLNYCLPIAKLDQDRLAIRKAMVSGKPYNFYGGDSAPHPIFWKSLKLLKGKSPRAGIFSAPVEIPQQLETFEKEGALDKFEDFHSVFGPQFYGIPLSQETLTVKKETWRVPYEYEGIPIFRGGEELSWQIA